MRLNTPMSRRAFLLTAAGSAAAVLAACTRSGTETASNATPSLAQAVPPSGSPTAVTCLTDDAGAATPLWEQALGRGLVYGSSAATWQLSDAEYRKLFESQAGILFTEDDLLWWRLKPTPPADLDFSYADRIIDPPSATACSCSAHIWYGTRGSATAGRTRTSGA
jgi:endo-1,4-beta-xylanase